MAAKPPSLLSRTSTHDDGRGGVAPPRTRPARSPACGRLRKGYIGQMDQAPDLNDALARLKAFRLTWNPGDIIDEQSGLTADDIDTLISFVDDFPSSD